MLFCKLYQRSSWGHVAEGDELIPVRSDTSYRLDYTEPAGDINITLPDYLKFIRLNLSGLEGQTNYLTADTYRFIHDGIKNYAIGWYNIREGEDEWSTHFGTAGTYFTVVPVNRHRKMAYVIFTNAFSDAVINGVRLLMRKLKEQYSG